MLQPAGLNYNMELQNAVPGDRLRFFDGKMAVVLGVCLVDMRTTLFRHMVKIIYGEYATPDKVMARWRAHAVVMGNGENAISPTLCLLVRFKEMEEESDGKKKKR